MTPPFSATPPSARSALAAAWVHSLLHFGHLHSAVEDRRGQWLIQTTPRGPVRLLNTPAQVLKLAAALQHQQREHGENP